MSISAIVMLVVAILIIWGGLGLALLTCTVSRIWMLSTMLLKLRVLSFSV